MCRAKGVSLYRFDELERNRHFACKNLEQLQSYYYETHRCQLK